ncbi:MAG: FlgD immunoglobulin-like domain containing protein, partial [Armatimonadota bacterium]
VIANHFDDPDLGDAYHYETVDLIRLYVEYLNGLLDPGDPTFPVPFSTPEVQQHAAYPLEAYADSVGVWAANYAEFSGTPPGDFTVYFTGDSRNVWSCRTALTTPDGTTTFGPPMPLDPATQRGSASFSEVGTTYERATLVIANHADYGRPPGTPPNDLAGYTYQTVGPPPAGDVNGDSNVDVNDLALFRMAFGGTSGLGADAVCGVYDQKCDLDEDGDVDWDDFWAMWYNNAPYHEGWVPGDVTGAAAKPGCPQGYPDAPPDDYLDIWDLIAFAAHWNTDTQSANWDEVFDFADSSGLAAPAAARPVPMDGVVNIFDLVKFAAAWHTGSGPAGSATSKGRALAQAARPLLRLVGPGDGIVGVGDEVEVQVVADDVTSLTGFDFKVTYDATLLKLTQHEVRQGNFLAIRGGRALVMEDLKKPGIAWFSGALAARDSSLAPSGTGRLARLRFRVIAEGPIELELRDGLVFTDDVWAVTSSRRLGLSAVRFGGDNWRIPIVLKAGDATESQHFIGVVSALAEAAPSARSLSDAQAQRRLTFELPDGTRAASAYLPAARGTLTCRFTVEGLEPGTEVTLAWPDLSQAPKDRVPLLCDLDSGASIFVRTAPAYHFGSGAGGVRHFEIRFEKSKAAAGRLIRNVVVRPLRGGAMGIAFDLDASASVSVEVINVAGRRVRRLAADRTMAAGRATLTWDGRSDAGTPVPRGTYLLRAVARSADGRRSRAVAVVSL